MKYYINTAGLPTTVSQGDYLAAIDNAFGAWQNVSSSYITFERVGFGTAYSPADSSDGMVTVGFGNATPGALAHASYSEDGSELVEFDVVLGGDRATWSARPSGPGVGQMDLWSVTTHEIGHGLGLGHSEDTNASMYIGIYIASTRQRYPNHDDIAAISSINRKGDLNDNQVIDTGEVEAFILAVTDRSAFASQYSHVDPVLRADMNNDGVLDCDDREAYDNLLTSQGVPASMASQLCAIDNGQINGTVWHDANRDMVIDADERRLSGTQVFLDRNNNGKLDAQDVSVTTNASGLYSFIDLADGTYHVAEIAPAGWVDTVPGGRWTVDLSAGQSLTRNFGNLAWLGAFTALLNNFNNPVPQGNTLKGDCSGPRNVADGEVDIDDLIYLLKRLNPVVNVITASSPAVAVNRAAPDQWRGGVRVVGAYEGGRPKWQFSNIWVGNRGACG